MADIFSTQRKDQAINALAKLGFSFNPEWRLSFVETSNDFYGYKPTSWMHVLISINDTPIPALFMDPDPQTLPDLSDTICSSDFLTASASPADFFKFCTTHDLDYMPFYKSPDELEVGDYDAWLADYSAWCEERGYDCPDDDITTRERRDPIQVTFTRAFFPGEKSREEVIFGGAWSLWGDDWNDAPYPSNAGDVYTSMRIFSHKVPPFADEKIPPDAFPINRVDDKWITFGDSALPVTEHTARLFSGTFCVTTHEMPTIRFAVHQKHAPKPSKLLKDAIWWPLP